MYETRHNANLGFTGCNDARAVRANQAAILVFQILFHFYHILNRNAFGDADNHFNAGFSSFHDGIGSKGGRYKNEGDIGSGFLNRFRNRIKNWPIEVGLSAFSRCDPSYHIGTVFNHLSCMKSAFGAGKALHNNF